MSNEADRPRNNIRLPVEIRFDKFSRPFSRFIEGQSTGALLLVLSAAAALILANSPWQDFYYGLEELEFGFSFDSHHFSMNLHEWVNDGLMVLFFFLLGLEIKREFIAGELESFRNSGTVILAALGGMICPAVIFALLNYGSDTIQGWGVPMATDTAFAIGAMALLGSHIHHNLRVFLVALAIVDDIGAVIVIAVFYTDHIAFGMLALSGVIFAVMVLVNILGIRHPLPYAALGAVLWWAVFQSGIHATIAGVLAAFAIPARSAQHPDDLAVTLRKAADRVESVNRSPLTDTLADEDKDRAMGVVEYEIHETRAPVRIWEGVLDKPVGLLVVPVFAFLNAGTTVSVDSLIQTLQSPLAWGIILGLLLGKPVGITLLTWLTLKLNLGSLPEGLTIKDIAGMGLLAGMGFTMSVFVSGLSFSSMPEQLLQAKTAIIIATCIAGIAGMAWLRFMSRSGEQTDQ